MSAEIEVTSVIDDRWRIERQLGEGGQAHTFLVTDTQDGSRAALKRLKNATRLPRFEQEIAAIGALNHPRIVRLIYANTSIAKPYLVSEYCPLGSLEDQKESILKLPVDDRLELVTQIVQGVAAAHAVGIVHRDLKPSNIFLRAPDDVVVGDFGICFVESESRITETWEAVGARYYMAPELAEGRAEQVTPSADVYAIGKIIYWILTGKVFDRENHRAKERLLTNFYDHESILHVHRLLDVTIALEPEKRLRAASAVGSQIVDLRRLLRAGFPTLEHPPRRCRYCGIGDYYDIGNNSAAVFNFGIQPGFRVPRIYCCEHCGHVEIFQPARATNSKWLG